MLRVALAVVLGLVALSAFLSVNIFPIVGNDSVLYLDHSQNLSGGGWVEYGYRQFGYPLVLAVNRFFANALNADALLSMAMLQRLLLAAGAVLAWRFWRWWSLPLIAFLVSAETLAHANFILTESLAMPLAVLLVFPTILCIEILQRDEDGSERRRLMVYGAIVAAGVLVMYSLRFTFAVFAAIPLVLAIQAWRTPHRRLMLWVLGLSVSVIAVIGVLTSLENQREHGVLTPTASGNAVRYYFAWQQVFEVHPENPHDDDLARFYDRGQVHDFSRGVQAQDDAAYDAEIEAMLEAAGIPVFGSKVQSFWYSLIGGRLDDLEPAVQRTIDAQRLEVDPLIYLNQYAMRQGRERFVNEYNDGMPVGAVITDPVGMPSPLPSARDLASWMVPISLVVMAIGLAFPSTRPLSAIGLIVVLAFALGVGWLRADNFRFLITTSAFSIAAGSGVLAALMSGVWRGDRGSDEASSGDPVESDQGEDRVPAS